MELKSPLLCLTELGQLRRSQILRKMVAGLQATAVVCGKSAKDVGECSSM